jgi:hypothetical protein
MIEMSVKAEHKKQRRRRTHAAHGKRLGSWMDGWNVVRGAGQLNLEDNSTKNLLSGRQPMLF